MPHAGNNHADSNHAYWRFRCRALASRVFAGRVLDALGPWVLAGCTIGACAIVLSRFLVIAPALGPRIAFGAILSALGASVTQAFTRGRPRLHDMRVRLEQALGLHNQLSAAAEGAIGWPPPPPTSTNFLSWQWSRILPLPFASVALLAIAFALPIHPPERIVAGPREKPPALVSLEEIVQQLDTARMADEHALEALRQQVGQLAARDPEGWYTHDNLEASESLLRQTQSGLSELAGNFSSAASAVDHASAAGEGNGNDTQAHAALDAALHGLDNSRLPAADELRHQLRDVAAGKLDPAAMQRLAQKLRDNASRAQAMGSGGYSSRQFAILGAGSTPGHPGGDNGDTVNGNQAGAGGVTRGPGTAPLSLAENPSDAKPASTEALEGFDPERAALGDITGQSTGRHEIDRAVADQQAAGGSLAVPAGGGESAWTQRLTPAERRAVQRTFE